EFVPDPNLTTTLPPWFQQQQADLPPNLQGQLQPNTQEGLLAPDSAFWTDLERRVRARSFHRSGLVAGTKGQIHVEDYPTAGGLLFGFFAAKDGFAPYFQPIYLTRNGEVAGRAYGRARGDVVCYKARPGYAVGGMYVHAGELFNGVAVTFMKVNRQGLDRSDWYQSGWVGATGGKAAAVGHDGRFIVGVHGKLLASEYFSPRGAMTTVGSISLR